MLIDDAGLASILAALTGSLPPRHGCLGSQPRFFRLTTEGDNMRNRITKGKWFSLFAAAILVAASVISVVVLSAKRK